MKTKLLSLLIVLLLAGVAVLVFTPPLGLAGDCHTPAVGSNYQSP